MKWRFVKDHFLFKKGTEFDHNGFEEVRLTGWQDDPYTGIRYGTFKLAFYVKNLHEQGIIETVEDEDRTVV
jgi:hypothetical protein